MAQVARTAARLAAEQRAAMRAAERAFQPALPPAFLVWPMRAGYAAELLDSTTDAHVEDVVRTVCMKFGCLGAPTGVVDEAAVRDAVSDVLERLYRQNPYIDDGIFAYWYTAACNSLRDLLRHRKRFPMVSMQGTSVASRATGSSVDGAVYAVEAEVNAALGATTRPGPLQALLVSELRDALIAWMSRLSTRARVILVARHIEGRTATELAQELGISEGAVRMTLHRTVAMLREWIEHEYPDAREAWQETT